MSTIEETALQNTLNRYKKEVIEENKELSLEKVLDQMDLDNHNHHAISIFEASSVSEHNELEQPLPSPSPFHSSCIHFPQSASLPGIELFKTKNILIEKEHHKSPIQLDDSFESYEDQIPNILNISCLQNTPCCFYCDNTLPQSLISPTETPYIYPCSCQKAFHRKCLAAYVLMTKKILCPECNTMYNMYFKEGRELTTQTSTNLSKNTILLILLLTFYFGIACIGGGIYFLIAFFVEHFKFSYLAGLFFFIPGILLVCVGVFFLFKLKIEKNTMDFKIYCRQKEMSEVLKYPNSNIMGEKILTVSYRYKKERYLSKIIVAIGSYMKSQFFNKDVWLNLHPRQVIIKSVKHEPQKVVQESNQANQEEEKERKPSVSTPNLIKNIRGILQVEQLPPYLISPQLVAKEAQQKNKTKTKNQIKNSAEEEDEDMSSNDFNEKAAMSEYDANPSVVHQYEFMTLPTDLKKHNKLIILKNQPTLSKTLNNKKPIFC